MMMSSSLTGLMIGKIMQVARSRQLYDCPGGRHVHAHGVSRLGGFAFMPSIVLSISLILCINLLKQDRDVVSAVADYVSAHVFTLSFGTAAVTCLYLLGLFDDLFGVRYQVKLAVQFFAACLLAVGGLTVSNLHGFIGIGAIPHVFALPLSVLVILFIINAINFIDGIDGLASAMAALCMAIPGLTAVSTGDYIMAVLIFAAVGTLLPFFCYNVWGTASRGTKIFMGDAGSLTLGIVISILVVRMFNAPPAATHPGIIPVITGSLAVPCLDVLRVMTYRVCHGRNLFIADRSHIHYRLLALGMSHAQATGTIIAWTVSFILLDTLIAALGGGLTVIVALNAAYWTAVHCLITTRVRQLRHAGAACAYLCD